MEKTRLKVKLFFILIILSAGLQSQVVVLPSYQAVHFQAQLPKVSTIEVTDVTTESAQSGGIVVCNGGAKITAKGVCWSESPDPTIEDNITIDGEDNENFVSYLENLAYNLTYYVRAYATNSIGTSYGEVFSFNSDWECGNSFRHKGHDYETFMIAEKCWFSENLRTDKYLNGDPILTNLSDSEWVDLNITETGAYAIYPHSLIDGLNSDAEVLTAYGALYNWHAVDDERGICPAGWHVPTITEWEGMADYLITNNAVVTSNNVANHLKNCRQIDSPLAGDCDTNIHPRWEANATHYGLDSFGFSVLPGGSRNLSGEFIGIGETGNFWTSSPWGGHAQWRGFSVSSGSIFSLGGGAHRFIGYSVRCIKD